VTDYYWTAERAAELRDLWQDGLSCSAIARALGGGLTRSAVIGKAHRIGLHIEYPRGDYHPQVNRVPQAPRPRRASMRNIPTAVPEPEAARRDDGSFVTLLDARQGDCRWPIGDPQNADFHLCGNGTALGKHYCEFHVRKAVAGPPIHDIAEAVAVSKEVEAVSGLKRIFG